MTRKIIWSPSAEQDFEQILNYLFLKWNKKVVIDFITITNKLIIHISANPKQFPLIHKTKKVRKCVLTKHNTLYYSENIDGIQILRIFDTRQHPGKLKT